MPLPRIKEQADALAWEEMKRLVEESVKRERNKPDNWIVCDKCGQQFYKVYWYKGTVCFVCMDKPEPTHYEREAKDIPSSL